jgi:hypothetical protein
VKKKICLPIIALAIGFANACLAFQVHSMLFCLLPLWAFAFGYFSSSWKTGLLSSFLLFIGYTSATTLMIRGVFGIDPVDYLYNFLFGGFILCLVGCGAPTVKRGVKNFKSIGTLIILVLLVSWCGYLSFPKYSYCYQVIIESSEDLDDLELYLPMGAVSQEPYTEIYDHPFQLPEGSFKGGLLEDYSLEMIDTKYGEMLKLDIPGLQEKFKPGEETVKLGPKPPTPAEITPESYPYSGSIIFDMSHAPHEKLQFLPKLDVKEVKIVRSERFMGPIRVEAGEVIEEFKVPIKVGSDKEAEVKIWLNHRGGRHMAINFYASKGEGYSESVELQTTTSAEWILADGEAARGVGVSGVE